MKVIIAEKPSVAQAIASVVGARQRKEGYLMGDGYAVAWAFGHLVGLAMPESYGLSGFRREHLPILPQEFRLVPRQVREGKAYKDDPGVVRQLGVIRNLFDRCESIIVATDAGREGELISVTCTTISVVPNPLPVCGSPRSPTRPSVRDCGISGREAFTTTFTSPPKPAARRTGSWASTVLRHSALPPDRACSPWDGYRHPHWR